MNTNEHSHQNRESGQVLAFVAVLLIVLVAMLGLVLDGGNLYLHRRRMQNAADAGAIAGARILCLEGTDITTPEAQAAAQQAAQEYSVTRNQADTADITVDDWTVTVVAHKDVPMTFARIIGIDQLEISALAAAMCGPAGWADGLNPIAVMSDTFKVGEDFTYTIWDKDEEMDPDGFNLSGSSRGWVSLPCAYPDTCQEGASDLADWMVNGYDDAVLVDSYLRPAYGTVASVWMLPEAGDTLMLPVYDVLIDMDNGLPYYHIVSFAIFEVESTIKDQGDKGIVGHFVGYVQPSVIVDGPDGGMRTVALIR